MNVTQTLHLDTTSPATLAIQGGTTALLSTYLNQAYLDMLPWILAAVPLILGDLLFGIARVRQQGQKIQYLKALTLTINKTISYVCWILISTTLGIAFSAPAIKYTIMGIVYLKEVVSCFRNYFGAKGYEVNESDLLRLLWRAALNRLTPSTNEIDELHHTLTKKTEKQEPQPTNRNKK